MINSMKVAASFEHGKVPLDPVRLANLLAWVWIAYRLAPLYGRWLTHTWANPFILCGRPFAACLLYRCGSRSAGRNVAGQLERVRKPSKLQYSGCGHDDLRRGLPLRMALRPMVVDHGGYQAPCVKTRFIACSSE